MSARSPTIAGPAAAIRSSPIGAKSPSSFKLPLLVAEGGTDPASYRYRFLFLEPWYRPG